MSFQNRALIVVTFTLAFALVGCFGFYDSLNKRKFVINQKYVSSDSVLVIGDYTIYFNSYLNNDNALRSVNEDSILKILSTSINKLDLKVDQIDNGSNSLSVISEKFFKQKKLLRIPDISKVVLNELVSKNNINRVILFPVIHIYETIHYPGPQNGVYNPQVYLSVIIYIFENNQIRYLKHAACGPISSYNYFPVSSDDTFTHPPERHLEQQHWDKVVEIAMREYLERLNKNE